MRKPLRAAVNARNNREEKKHCSSWPRMFHTTALYLTNETLDVCVKKYSETALSVSVDVTSGSLYV